MITPLLLASALTMPAGLGLATSSSATATTATATTATHSAPLRAVKATDITKLAARALAKVRAKKKFANAILLEADGKPKASTVITRAAQVTSWRFAFDNQKTKGSKFRSVVMKYTAGDGFGRAKGHTAPWLEDRRIPKIPTMKLRWAVELYKGAGNTDGFTTVTLRRPLGTATTPPLYVFGTPTGDYVAVNARTGKVRPIG